MSGRLPSIDSLQPDLRQGASATLSAFEKVAGMRGVKHYVKSRADGAYLVIGLAYPGERHYSLLESALGQLPEDNPFRERTTIERWSHEDRLDTAETRLLQRVLSESLTVGRDSFREDFFARYIRSVSGEEEKIESAANHVVFGRRGAGKSSLLVYAMRRLEEEKSPFAWVAMQTFGGRGDNGVIVQVLIDIIEQLRPELEGGAGRLQTVSSMFERLRSDGPNVTTEAIQDVLPEVKRLVSPLAQRKRRVTIFVDDLHVVQPALQPALLASLYAFSRGNSIHLKVSAIENLARIWEQSSSSGLELPNDAQAIRLDHNLTMPDKSLTHITKILDAHARYCALPSVGYLSSPDVLTRLVWVAAAVPRDAINIFSQAITRAATQSRKQVAVTDVNTAASEATEDKMRNLKQDSSGGSEELLQLLEGIKKFCSSKGKNAFLVLVAQNDPMYQSILKLVGLRFLHVLSTGITPDQAGERYMALMLDYGLYVSVRRARSMDLFQKTPKSVPYKELRKFPRFESDSSPTRSPSRRRPARRPSRRSSRKH
jgi:histone H3/H4